MPAPSIYLGRISNASLLEKKLLKGQAGTLAVEIENNSKALLDLRDQRAGVWLKMMDYLQENNRPVYLEMNDSNIVTKLYVPRVSKVLLLEFADDIVYVSVNSSETILSLHPAHVNYVQMLEYLQRAFYTGLPVLVTATHTSFEIIDVRHLLPGLLKEEPVEPEPEPIEEPSLVSWEKAVELFNRLSGLSCTHSPCTTPCLPYKYPYSGCWVRAHLMCLLLVKEGLVPEKMWIGFGSLNAASSNAPLCSVGWSFHVAPTLLVTLASGTGIKMVLDPSLCDKPVTPEEWKSLMRKKTAILTATSWRWYSYGATDRATPAKAEKDMQEFRIMLDDLWNEFGPSPYSCPIVKKLSFTINKNKITKDEIDDMLKTRGTAVIENAFDIILDGFTPDELGITTATLSGVPDIVPSFTQAPSIPQMEITVMPTLILEDPVHLVRRQGIIWRYKIIFKGTEGFSKGITDVDLSATIETVSANGKITLLAK